MYDTAPHSSRCSYIIPREQINETRRLFPEAELVFDLLIDAPDKLRGLEQCAGAFAAARLELRLLRCTDKGRIACRLVDSGCADLEQLERALSGPLARIESWTTEIGSLARRQ